MARHKGTSYKGATVHLDGDEFEDCTFERCKIVYAGGAVSMEGCSFTGCNWELAGAALNTLAFFRMLYVMPGMRDFMEKTLDNIRGKNLN